MGSWGRWGGRLNSCVKWLISERWQQRVRSAAHFEEIGKARGGKVDVGVRGVFGLVGEVSAMQKLGMEVVGRTIVDRIYSAPALRSTVAMVRTTSIGIQVSKMNFGNRVEELIRALRCGRLSKQCCHKKLVHPTRSHPHVRRLSLHPSGPIQRPASLSCRYAKPDAKELASVFRHLTVSCFPPTQHTVAAEPRKHQLEAEITSDAAQWSGQPSARMHVIAHRSVVIHTRSW